MPEKIYSIGEIAKLKQLVTEGVQVSQEIQDLREGLRDTVNDIAHEMEIKPATLNKAIKIAHKVSLSQTKDDFDAVEDVLVAVGRTA
jgi:hypothetical protein|tara:strand:+ start:58 stop:318 length:261 start_codon:yes stop_codon:yes gene_type:complete